MLRLTGVNCKRRRADVLFSIRPMLYYLLRAFSLTVQPQRDNSANFSFDYVFSSLVTSVFVILSQKGIDAFLADAPSSDCHRLASAAAKDPATRTEKVPASSGGSGSHPAQNDTNLP